MDEINVDNVREAGRYHAGDRTQKVVTLGYTWRNCLKGLAPAGSTEDPGLQTHNNYVFLPQADF